MYTYKAIVLRVIDGDTVKLSIDLGFRVFWTSNCRLADINAPEMNTEEGKASKAHLQTIISEGEELTIVSRKLDKYGRPVVLLFKNKDYVNNNSVNANMLSSNHAVKYQL